MSLRRFDSFSGSSVLTSHFIRLPASFSLEGSVMSNVPHATCARQQKRGKARESEEQELRGESESACLLMAAAHVRELRENLLIIRTCRSSGLFPFLSSPATLTARCSPLLWICSDAFHVLLFLFPSPFLCLLRTDCFGEQGLWLRARRRSSLSLFLCLMVVVKEEKTQKKEREWNEELNN